MEKTIKKHYGGIRTFKNDYIDRYMTFLESQKTNKKVIKKIIKLLNKYNSEGQFKNKKIKESNINKNNINDEINISILEYLLQNIKIKNHSLIKKLNSEFEQSYKNYKKTTQTNISDIMINMPKLKTNETVLKVSNHQKSKKFSFPSLRLQKFTFPKFTRKEKTLYKVTSPSNSQNLQNLPLRLSGPEQFLSMRQPNFNEIITSPQKQTGRLPNNKGRDLYFNGTTPRPRTNSQKIKKNPMQLTGSPSPNFSFNSSRKRESRRGEYF
jgi:hypothetical protein